MANPSEADKYDVLEKIGIKAYIQLAAVTTADNYAGHGSFGVIHKVRRKSDTKVNKQSAPHLPIVTYHVRC